ncbi:hypothetical protein K501DRAFT_243756 [Backusella circina FSU 941]|nr:hypothetical protein K501DRAFT_243756 [Backusella circina FSU 941]
MADRTKKIANILQTYFSDANLLWDKVLASMISKDPHGFVTFDALSKLTKLKQLKATPEEIKQAAEEHALDKLQVQDNRIARIKPYVPYGADREEEEDRSIYVEGLPAKYKDQTKIVDYFEKHVGHVTLVRIPKNRYNKVNFCGHCFVEFETSEIVQKAIDVFEQNDKLDVRVISKRDWLKYKDEYLAFMSKKKEEFKELWSKYKTEQMDEDTDEANQESTTVKRHIAEDDPAEIPAAKKPKMEDTKKELDYTPGVIILVNKLHLDAPKTVVTKLLEESGVKIPFMKPKRKGMDSTFIRLNTPQDAIKLHNYFESHHIIQQDSKDATGKEADNASHETISTKIIQGKEEEMYWKEDMKKMK